MWERRSAPEGLRKLVEGAHALAPGRALDLGCGSGTDSVYLAQHGWHVTGVDLVPEALALARRALQPAHRLRLLARAAHGPAPGLRLRRVDDCQARRNDAAVWLRPATVLFAIQAGLSESDVRARFEDGWQVVSAERVLNDPIVVARSRVDRSFQLWQYQLRRS